MTREYEDEIAWFRENPEETERVRAATVAEQVRMFEKTGGEIHDSIRVVRGDWYRTEGQDAAILRLSPA